MKNSLRRGWQLRQKNGFTLIEMMIALAIGSFLIIGAVQIYTQSRQSYIVNESIAKVQDIATFAIDTLESDLRMASNWGKAATAWARLPMKPVFASPIASCRLRLRSSTRARAGNS